MPSFLKVGNKRLFVYTSLETSEPILPDIDTLKEPDEVPHKASFRLGLHCLLRQNRSSEKKGNIVTLYLILIFLVRNWVYKDLLEFLSFKFNNNVHNFII